MWGPYFEDKAAISNGNPEKPATGTGRGPGIPEAARRIGGACGRPGGAGRGRGWSALVLLVASGLAALGAAASPPARAGALDPRRAALRARLEERLARLTGDLEGSSSYAVRDLTTGEVFENQAGVAFPAASTIKLPIAIELYRQIEEGRLEASATVPIDPEARVEGGGVLEKLAPPYPVLSAEHLAVLMMDFSDNYAANLLIGVVGMERVNRRLDAWGLRSTRLRRRMLDVEAARAGRENVTTARDLVALLDRLHRGRLLDDGHTNRLLGVMERNHDTPLRRGLPRGVIVADKEGDLDGVRCGAAIVQVRAAPPAAARPFAVAVMTSRLLDDAAGEAYVGAVARAAYDYFLALPVPSDD